MKIEFFRCSDPIQSCLFFVHPAIKSAWWNSGNGCAWMFSKRCPIDILSWASRRSCADTSSEPVPYLIREQEASCRSPPSWGQALVVAPGNPHCHILVTDGCFYGNKGMFRVAPPLELKKLEAIPRSGRGQASITWDYGRQEQGRRSTSLSQPHRSPLFFDANYSLTSKNSPPILPSSKAMPYQLINSTQPTNPTAPLVRARPLP